MGNWFPTNDKEFAKRMFKAFMKAFFVQALITVVAIVFTDKGEQVTSLFIALIPVYSLVFGAVIAKSGVENVYKGKTASTSVTLTTGGSVDSKATTKPPSNG